MPAPRHDAIYVRVSSRKQDEASQTPELERWAAAQAGPVVWYRDTASGKTMDRPGWRALEDAVRSGAVRRVVAWRLDRFGRTARGLTALIHELTERGVGMVSLREGIDLSTPAGRMVANVLASMAQFETELRSERVIAGLAAARVNGTRSGRPAGNQPGSVRARKLTAEKRLEVCRMLASGRTVSAVARVVGVSRETLYQAIREERELRGLATLEELRAALRSAEEPAA